jgi:hypothetical protein
MDYQTAVASVLVAILTFALVLRQNREELFREELFKDKLRPLLREEPERPLEDR